ncbi:hypothetical protein GCM10009647_013920 [Streptomyces sanglieri]
MVRDGADQGGGGGRSQHHGGHVDGAVGVRELGEAGLEDNGQQKAEEDLDAGLGDPQFLEQIGPPPVRPFLGRLVAAVVAARAAAVGAMRCRGHREPPSEYPEYFAFPSSPTVTGHRERGDGRIVRPALDDQSGLT